MKQPRNNPATKALELVWAFQNSPDEDGFVNKNSTRAKNSALIAVDEILSFLEDDRDGFNWKSYYQEVKREIQNI